MSAAPNPSLPPVLVSRLQKELQALATQPPPGVTCWPVSESDITKLHATIVAPKGSCYDGGVFTVEVQVPLRYPFEPPKARFVTPVYVCIAAQRSHYFSVTVMLQVSPEHRRPRPNLSRRVEHVIRPAPRPHPPSHITRAHGAKGFVAACVQHQHGFAVAAAAPG